MKLSIVVPTKNEKSAPAFLAKLRKEFGNDVEILVVDKSTEQMRKGLHVAGARVIVQDSVGYLNAVMEGLGKTKGDVLAVIDADETYLPSDLKRVINELNASPDYAMVLGSRFGNLEKGAMSGSIKFGNKFLTGLFNLLYRKSVGDVLSGSFALRREAFEDIRDEPRNPKTGTLFLEIALVRRGYMIKDIPITYKPRTSGEAQIKAKPVVGLVIASHAIRYTRDYNPLVIFGSIGVVSIVIGIIVGIFVLGNFAATGALSEPGRALIAFMLVVIGFLSVIAGLILDLLLEIERKLYQKRER